ncbi:hypothetical protein WJX74_005264 [Apatococcus lobatus]|uniref:Uncharacterized protein n=2 Tax=Apatococcus TaxID=904362 RepID=A0AAW1TFQ0_9CHLO
MSSHPWQFYAKVSAVCFAAGGAMELFMVKTGFYDKVTELEAERREDSREDREAFRKMLRQEIERQAREKHLDIRLPPETAHLQEDTFQPFSSICCEK